MTKASMPGRNPPVACPRNCYLSDEEVERREHAVAAWKKAADDHSLPELVWWAIVALASIAAFATGLFLGGDR